MFLLNRTQAKAKANVIHKYLLEKGIELPSSELLNAVARMAGLEDWNAMAAQFSEDAVDALLADQESDHAFDSLESELRAEETGIVGFGPECAVQVASGFWLVTPGYPADVDYVRVCDPLGREVAYWSIDEITEDASIVVGAIVGALNRSRTDKKPNPLKPSADKIVVADGAKKPDIKCWGDVNWRLVHAIEYVDANLTYEHKLRFIEDDSFRLLDLDAAGTIDADDLAELEDLMDDTALDWGDEFEAGGLTVRDLRGAKRNNVTKTWELTDGRTLKFLQLNAM